MKFILLGDVHLRSSKPSMRKDEFTDTQYKKISEVVEFSNSLDVPIVCTGDLFDRPNPPYKLVNKYIEKFRELKNNFYVVPGNHDVYGASLSTLENSALSVMASAGVIKLLSDEPLYHEGVEIVGRSYFDGVKVPTSRKSEGYGILVLHEMVIQDKLWKEQSEDSYIPTDSCAEVYPGWDLILCGHYHYSFCIKSGDTWVVNPGALVRVKASKGDSELSPGFFLLDTKENSLENYHLESALPYQEVFQDPIPEISGDYSKIDDFVSAVGKDESSTVNISDLLVKLLEDVKNEKVSELVKHYIASAEERSG